MKFSYLILILCVLISSCGGEDVPTGFTEGKKGVLYRLVSFSGSTKKIEKGDYVFLKAVYKTGKDSIFWDWKYNAGKNYYFRVTDEKMDSEFFGFLLDNFTANDSLDLRIDKTLFFREVFDTLAPWFMRSDSMVRVELKIDKVMNEAAFSQFLESREMIAEAERWQQKRSIEEWMQKNLKRPEKADSLLYFERLVSTTDSMVVPGKAVTVCYSGSFLDGRIFDEVSPAKPLTINFGYEAQMLKGIEKILPRLRKGESAKIILPSHLAFGEYGSSNGTVPPNTPVIYQIRIIDIKQ